MVRRRGTFYVVCVIPHLRIDHSWVDCVAVWCWSHLILLPLRPRPPRTAGASFGCGFGWKYVQTILRRDRQSFAPTGRFHISVRSQFVRMLVSPNLDACLA